MLKRFLRPLCITALMAPITALATLSPTVESTPSFSQDVEELLAQQSLLGTPFGDAMLENANANDGLATNFNEALSALALPYLNRPANEIYAELSDAMTAALSGGDEATAGLLFQVYMLASTAGLCEVAEPEQAGDNRVTTCAVGLAPLSRNASDVSMAGTLGEGEGQRTISSMTLSELVDRAQAGTVAHWTNMSARSSAASSSGHLSNFDYMLRDTDSSRCNQRAPGPRSHSEYCDDFSGDKRSTVGGVNVDYAYAGFYIIQTICGNSSCRLYGEVAGGLNAKYATLSDTVMFELGVGAYCGTSCMGRLLLDAIALAIDSYVFDEDINSSDVIRAILGNLSFRQYDLHLGGSMNTLYVGGCPIIPSNYELHPTFHAEDAVNAEIPEEFGGLVRFEFGTHFQRDLLNDGIADEALHAFPVASSVHTGTTERLGVNGDGVNPNNVDTSNPVQATSMNQNDLNTYYEFSRFRAFNPNVVLVTSAFTESDVRSCRTNRSIRTDFYNRYMGGFGSAFVHFFGPAYPGNEFTRHSAGGLPQFEIFIGFDASTKAAELATGAQVGVPALPTVPGVPAIPGGIPDTVGLVTEFVEEFPGAGTYLDTAQSYLDLILELAGDPANEAMPYIDAAAYLVGERVPELLLLLLPTDAEELEYVIDNVERELGKLSDSPLYIVNALVQQTAPGLLRTLEAQVSRAIDDAEEIVEYATP